METKNKFGLTRFVDTGIRTCHQIHTLESVGFRRVLEGRLGRTCSFKARLGFLSRLES